MRSFLASFVFLLGVSALAQNETSEPASQAWGPEIFPESYTDSRQKFREICQALQQQSAGPSGPQRPATKADVECLSHPLENAAGEDLTVDSLWAPAPGATKILVLVSGVHGAEASTGAAVQFQFVMNQLPQYNAKGISVLLIHALNPWGFAHGRRVTANNIDLNRNFPSREDVAWVPNKGYEKLRPQLEPENLRETGTWPFVKFAMSLLWKIVTFQFGVDEMNQAVAGGQRESPKGLFYGGFEPEPQIRQLKDFLDFYLKGHKQAVMIDLHTGLGEAGVLHLMPSDRPSVSGQALRSRLFQNPLRQGNEGTPIYKITTEDNQGFYHVSGDFLDFAEERGPEDLEIAAMTMEFGTRGTSIPAQLKSLFIMVSENTAYQDQSTRPWTQDETLKAQLNFYELFSPSDPNWRRNVLVTSDSFFNQLLSRF